MVDQLNQAIEVYDAKWQAFAAGSKQSAFFAGLQPTSIGWKTTDRADFDQRYAILRELSDQVHLGWVNERWLATFHLRASALARDITVIKLMERRPGSTDAAGLDHLDFYVPPATDVPSLLAAETGVKWTKEMNGDHCKWISLWFADTEAKLRSDTVIDVCIAEMQALQLTRSLENS